jgi:hypothetical protein
MRLLPNLLPFPALLQGYDTKDGFTQSRKEDAKTQRKQKPFLAPLRLLGASA